MHVVVLSDHLALGGGAIAANRLALGLGRAGHRVTRIVAPEGIGSAPSDLRSALKVGLDQGYRVVRAIVPQASAIRERAAQRWLEAKLRELRPDVISVHNLHGAAGKGWTVDLLRVCARYGPVVWTLHDMWALTGHCGYAYDCELWRTGCHACPLFDQPGRCFAEPPAPRVDRTRHNWETKRRAYADIDLHLVTPSQWLLGLVEESLLGSASDLHCIPNGVELDLFRPMAAELARQALDVPVEARVILFASERIENPRKGFRDLVEGLARLEERESVVLLTLGDSSSKADVATSFPRIDLGRLINERLMRMAFAAADLFVFPTLADNQPLVLIEAMACGVPVVSCNVGGVAEIVRHMETGYLTRTRDPRDLARGIDLLLGDEALRLMLAERSRQVAQAEYDLDQQVGRYTDLFADLVKEWVGGKR